MGWPVVYAVAPLLAVGIALGLAAVVAEEGSKLEVAGIEEESASEQPLPAPDEAPVDDRPAGDEMPAVRQDAPPATAARTDRSAAASSPTHDSTEQEARGFIDPDAPVVEEAAEHHVGDRRDPDAPPAVSEDEPVRHVGELLDTDAP